MTNMPLNTVASATSHVNGQRNESARVERRQVVKDRQRQEEIEDPAEDAVVAVRDGDQKQDGQGKKKNPHAPVDVAELTQEDGSITKVQAKGYARWRLIGWIFRHDIKHWGTPPEIQPVS